MASKKNNHEFLKANIWKEWEHLETDQKKQVPHPLLQKPYPDHENLINLVPPEDLTVGKMPLIEVIGQRRSRRKFTDADLTLEEFSFLLWATQGISEIIGNGIATLRTVPSGGARHPFETYLLVNRVAELEPGLYRYLPLYHKLCLLGSKAQVVEKVNDSSFWDTWQTSGAVLFLWTVIPYRTEWRYGPISPKLIVQDCGHLCQNLYLASESIGAGTCAIGAYDQEKIDRMLGVDGEQEFAICIAPVGKID
ncbi:MAG: SagB/ThcOx family dehydrogenase [Chloroflexi bacterium]|nr:SagB/ThcOx family dehydrogenase [Chloroflexota bacterium]